MTINDWAEPKMTINDTIVSRVCDCIKGAHMPNANVKNNTLLVT